MGLIQFDQRPLRQPQGRIGAADGVSAAWSAGGWCADAVSGQLPTVGASTAPAVRSIGRVLRVTGQASSNRAILASRAGRDQIGAGDFTVLVLAELVRTNVGYSVLGRWNSGGSPGTNEWFIGSGGTGGITSGDLDFWVEVGSTTYQARVAGAGWSAGVPYLLVGRRRGTTIIVDRCDLSTGVWHSGSTTNAGITTVNTVSGRNLTIGELASSSSLNADVDFYAGGIFPRALSDVEVAAAATHALWGMLFAARRICVPVSAGGGGTYNVTLAESTAAADALGAVGSVVAFVAEAAAASELASTVGTVAAAVSESAAAAETLAAVEAVAAALTEPATVADLVAATMVAQAAVAEALAAADVVSAGPQVSGAMAEAATAADALTVTASLVAQVAEAASAADAAATAQQLLALITEASTVADQVSGAAPAAYSVTLAEVAAALDVITAALTGTTVWPLLAARGVSAHGHGSARPEQLSTATRSNTQ